MQAAIAKSTHAHGKHVLNDLPPGAGESLIDAARNTARVSGLTHNFYKYPARFSPQLARAAIEAFTSRVDLVLDPFVGGGTTLVEAMALGRDAIGTDISALATFVATVKTTPYSDEVLERATHWGERAINCIDMHAASSSSNPYFESAGYCRHLDTSATWRLRKAIDQALASARELGDPLEPFARCVILRTAQWALDGKKQLPSVEKFRINLASNTLDMVNGARALGASVAAAASRRKPVIQCLTRDTIGLEVEPALRSARRPKLVITSPPYPGVHVLYHRWQVGGGRETAAPFWIANKLDGDGSAYYTMGARNTRTLDVYFAKLRAALTSIAAALGPSSTIIQVVAFSNPSMQLPRYLAAVDDVGLEEKFLPELQSTGDGRLWRNVPNRKWYADQRGGTSGSQEVILFHRLK